MFPLKSFQLFLVLLLLYSIKTTAQNNFIDTTFGENNGYTIFPNGILARGIVLVEDSLYTVVNQGHNYMYSHLTNGLPNDNFAMNGEYDSQQVDGYSLYHRYYKALHPTIDNQLIYTSSASFNNSPNSLAAKINSDGIIDSSFATNGEFLLPIDHSMYTQDSDYSIDGITTIASSYSVIVAPQVFRPFMAIFKIDNLGNPIANFGNNGVMTFPVDTIDVLPSAVHINGNNLYILENNDQDEGFVMKYDILTGEQDFNFGDQGYLNIDEISLLETTTHLQKEFDQYNHIVKYIDDFTELDLSKY